MPNPSLRDRFVDELTRDLAVSLTAICVAVAALLGYGWAIGSTVGGFTLAMVLALVIPEIHDRVWPTSYTGLAAVAWTVAAAVIVGGVFLAVEWVARLALAPTAAAGVGFVVTSAVAYALATVARSSDR
ncbi:hypothetical protein [Halococcoides cellulosivorans]|uniref:Uncharacterized protein n=1 Tax=Halococcoides cellulosivorans TaxID=1679096 RepID=A0A2R4X3U2_9EURY|nr:hypothetical protein [Halococcoides cellulosivorans]AWB28373.1 hypothetical protein HARCEL1_11975 [Halococcoides cellulosivorans]